ncbi:hypothetical protein D3C75_1206860 [compost metagenome]
MLQLVAFRGVQQQVDPVGLALAQQRHRHFEPPQVALAVEDGEQGVAAGQHRAGQCFVTPGDGGGFVEFHAGSCGLTL